MTKRKASSPYKNPPSPFVKRMTRAGWRRCDAEALAVLHFCLAHAMEGTGLRTLARHAAAALERPAVLAAAVLIVGKESMTPSAARALAMAAPPGSGRSALIELWQFSGWIRASIEEEEAMDWESDYGDDTELDDETDERSA